MWRVCGCVGVRVCGCVQVCAGVRCVEGMCGCVAFTLDACPAYRISTASVSCAQGSCALLSTILGALLDLALGEEGQL